MPQARSRAKLRHPPSRLPVIARPARCCTCHHTHIVTISHRHCVSATSEPSERAGQARAGHIRTTCGVSGGRRQQCAWAAAGLWRAAVWRCRPGWFWPGWSRATGRRGDRGGGRAADRRRCWRRVAPRCMPAMPTNRIVSAATVDSTSRLAYKPDRRSLNELTRIGTQSWTASGSHTTE